MKNLKINNLSLKLVYVWFLFFVPIQGSGEIYKAKITLPMVNHAPLINGKIDDAVWKECLILSDFVVWTLDAYTRDPVVVFLGYDHNNLYVAFKNSDPEALGLITEVPDKRLHDTFLWGRNFSRISLSNGKSSVALMGDPKGTMADWKDGDMSWNGTWTYAATIDKEFWSAEFQIPFKDLGVDNLPEDENWTLSLSRGFPSGESAEWEGVCFFSDDISTTFQFGRWPPPVPGKNTLKFAANNTGSEKIDIQCEIELIPFRNKPDFINQTGQGASSDMELLLRHEPLRFTYQLTIPPGIFQKDLLFELPTEGSYYATSTCVSGKGEVLLRNRGFWFNLESNSERLDHISMKLGEAVAAYRRVNGPFVQNLKKQTQVLMSDIESLREKIDPAWRNQHWDELSGQIDVMENKVDQYFHRVRWSALNNWKESSFGIAATHAIVKVHPDKPFPGTWNNIFNLSAARNEYESFQVVVMPFGENIKNLKVVLNDLVNENGSRISSEKISVSRVDFNWIDWQAAYVADKGWHPDPLIPAKEPITVPGSIICQPFWITVYVPPDTPPGLYKGNVTVSSSSGEPKILEINFRVWDFTLPVESHLKTHSWDDLDMLAGFYNLEEYPLEWYLRFCDLLLKNRMNPGSAGTHYVVPTPDASGNYDFSQVEKVLEYGLEKGLSRFSIIQLKKGPYEPEEAEKVYAFIEAYAKFLKERKWMDKALIELWDEPTSLEWTGVKARAERIRKIDPDLRLQLFAEGGPYAFWEEQSKKYGLQDLIDIWAPWKLVESPEIQEAGHEIWTYFCTLARGVAPNFYIDRPAIYQRLIAWYCWMYGVDGFEHWSTTYFWRNVKKGKSMSEKWPNAGWDSRTYHYYNGEGQLIYPGPEGWPLPSLRLEIFRDSMEDYEYLFMLNELLEKTEGNADDPDLQSARNLLMVDEYMLKKYPMEVKETQEHTIRFPDQPERILEMREQIAAAIEGLNK